MPIKEIRTVCYVGAGTMGCFNSIASAISGYAVVLYDLDHTVLARVSERHREMAELLVEAGYCSEEDIPVALARVSVTDDLVEATKNADLVSESVTENLEIKRDIHRQLDQLCPARTILTTNTSSLRVADIECVVERGDRFAALHSYYGSPLVDIVAGPRTDAAVLDILRRYVISTSGVPLLLKKDHPAYVLNALLGSILGTAVVLQLECKGSVEDIDRAWMRALSANIGPFGLMDALGLNVIHDAWASSADLEAVPAPYRTEALALMKSYLDGDHLGVKTGCGFYRYPGPAYQQPDFLGGETDTAHIYLPLLTALIGTAVFLAASDVASRDDIEMAWDVGTAGMGLEAGPFALLEDMGAEKFLSVMAEEVTAGRFKKEKAEVVEACLSARDTA